MNVRVTTNGGRATAAVCVSKFGDKIAQQNTSVPALDTQDVGACADVSAIVQ